MRCPVALKSALSTAGAATQIVDTELEPAVRDLARLRGYRSMLFTPLMSSGAPIGMISVTRNEPGKFAENHVVGVDHMPFSFDSSFRREDGTHEHTTPLIYQLTNTGYRRRRFLSNR